MVYVHVCEQARTARSAGSSAIKNACIIIILFLLIPWTHERERDRDIDRQTDRQTETDRRRDRQTDSETPRQREREREREGERERERERENSFKTIYVRSQCHENKKVNSAKAFAFFVLVLVKQQRQQQYFGQRQATEKSRIRSLPKVDNNATEKDCS